METKKNTYLTLFVSTFLLSAFTFGGGYVIVPMMKKKFVDQLKWIEEEEMLNLIALAQASPGAIAINTSILLGYRVAGIVGATITILGTVLPPFIIITVISFFYNAFRDNNVVSAVLKGMQAGVAAVIADVVINMGANITNTKEIFSIVIMITAFIVAFVFKVNVVFIILACAVIGAVKFLITQKSSKKGDKE